MEIFRGYDVRGIYPVDLDEDKAYRIARAYVVYSGAHTVVVGRDCRTSSSSLHAAVMRGVGDQGANVIDIGITSSPMMYFAAAGFKEHDGGLMVSASHSTKEWNGIKVCRNDGQALGRESGLGDIKKIYEQGNFPEPVRKGSVMRRDMVKPYLDTLFSLVPPHDIAPMKIVVDPANSVGSIAMQELVKRVPVALVPLYFDLDGTFPNHEANPLKYETLQALQARVVSEHATMGVAYDGDADRIIFVDDQGVIIPADLMGALLAVDLLQQNPGATVMYDVRCSMVMREEIERAGGVPLQWKVGHSVMKQKLRESGALFGCELAGHYYWHDFFNTESTDLVFLKVARIVSRAHMPLSQLMKPLRRYFHSGEINFTVADHVAKMEQIAAHYNNSAATTSRLDGVSCEFKDPGSNSVLWWFNVRPSANDPVLRLTLEARTKELMEEKREEVIRMIQA